MPSQSFDELVDQLASLQTEVSSLTNQLEEQTTLNRLKQYRIEELEAERERTRVIITQLTERHGAFSNRLNRLRGHIENPPKPFGQMTRPELVAFFQDFFNRITTPVPDDPNQDTA